MYKRQLREAVVGCKGDHEVFLQDVAAFEVGWLLAGLGSVLEGEREVQLAGAYSRGQVVAAFVDADLGVGVALAEACNGGGYEPGERGRERADAQPRALVVGGDGELRVGELEAFGDCVGVFEQDLALVGEPEAAGPAVKQPDADLCLLYTSPSPRDRS